MSASKSGQDEKKRMTAEDLKKEREQQEKRFNRQLWLWSALIVFFMLSMATLYGSSSRVRDLERKMTWGFQYELRDKLKKGPTVDPRLRILMFDDSTVQVFKRSGINFAEWASLLSYIDRHRPASIYIDKIFGLLDENAAVLQESLPTLKMLRTPVSIGSFTSSQRIPGRDPIRLQASQFRARNYLPSSLGEINDAELSKLLTESDLLDRSRAHVYGPMQPLQEVFRQGHIDYPMSNQIFPMYRVGEQAVLPSISLSGRINLKLDREGLSVGGERIPKTSNGTVLINWLNPAKVYAQAMSFASAFEAMKTGMLWDRIPEGAHVLILPLAFTGNVDFKESPYGQLPGGLVLASMINSALTKQWMAELENVSIVMLVLVCFAGLLQFVRGAGGWLFLFGGLVFIALFGLVRFVYTSTDVPWVAGEIFFGFTGIALLSLRSLWDARREKLIQRFEEEFQRLEVEEKRLEKEIRDAARVASVLKPEDVPDWPGLEISAFHRSMTEASGDWYFFELDASGRYAHFVLCDISGHGVQAALVVSGCKTVLSMMRLNSADAFSSHKFLLTYAQHLNEVLWLNGRGGHTATMVGVTFDLQTGLFYCIDCGHPFPILHSTIGRKMEPLSRFPSDPIGFNEEANFRLYERTMLPGDCLIAHSDGVPLTRGRRVLQKYFQEIEHGPLISAKRLFDVLIKHLTREKVEVIEDDVSLVIFRRID